MATVTTATGLGLEQPAPRALRALRAALTRGPQELYLLGVVPIVLDRPWSRGLYYGLP